MVTPDGDCKCLNCQPAHFIADRGPGNSVYLDEEQAKLENELRIARQRGFAPNPDTTDEELDNVVEFPGGKHVAEPEDTQPYLFGTDFVNAGDEPSQ